MMAAAVFVVYLVTLAAAVIPSGQICEAMMRKYIPAIEHNQCCVKNLQQGIYLVCYLNLLALPFVLVSCYLLLKRPLLFCKLCSSHQSDCLLAYSCF